MVEPHIIDRDINVNGRRGSLTVRVQQSENNSSATVENNSLPSTSSSSADSLESSPPLTSSHSFENNAIPVSNPSSNEKSAASSSSSSGDNAVQGTPLNLSTKENVSDQKSDKTRNLNISNDRNSVNQFSNPSSRRLDFLSSSYHNTGMAAFRDNSTASPSTGKQRERQLEALRRIEERLRNKNKEINNSPAESVFSAPAPTAPSSSSNSSGKKDTKPQSPSSSVRLLSPKMAMFVLDISCVLTDECFASWLPVKSVAEDSPDDMILYTLVQGNGELIMFGGIQKDAMSINQQAQSSVNITNIVSNSLHFITPPHSII